jgi:uncharacterized membrane protein YqiK
MIQQTASQEMQEKFAHYNLQLEEVLIGTPAPPTGDQQIETILTQLRSRQIATEQVETYGRQETAAVKERELREAQARAEMQKHITESELSITVQSNQGKAEYQRGTTSRADSHARRSGIGKGRAHRYRASVGNRRTSARVRRSAIPGYANGAQSFFRSRATNRD